jgi:hypothetical protein
MENKKWYWPDVSDLESAKKAARNGMWCAIFVASVTTIVVLLTTFFGLSIMGVKAGALLDAALFAGIAYGLSRYSRFAAVAGFALFVLEKIYMLATTGNFFSVGFLGIVIALGFWNSVRGTFAYYKLNGGAPSTGGLAGMFSGKSAPSPGARPLQM